MGIFKNMLKKELISEFWGTYIFLLIGIGCVAALKLTGASFSQFEISLIWGIGVAFGVYIAGDTSGAHLNPAVTIAFALFSNFSKKKILPYILIQFLASFSASITVFSIYYPLIVVKNIDTAGIFTTFPHQNLSFQHAFFIEFAITALLLFCIFIFTNEKNKLTKTISTPILIGLIVTVIGSSFGSLTGFAMNAARDFGPRVFTYFMGWPSNVMTADLSLPYFWVPLVAPILGALFGAFLYKVMFKNVFGNNS